MRYNQGQLRQLSDDQFEKYYNAYVAFFKELPPEQRQNERQYAALIKGEKAYRQEHSFFDEPAAVPVVVSNPYPQPYDQTQQQSVQPQQQPRNEKIDLGGKMFCPKCSGNNVIVSAVAEQKKRGCLGALMWIIISVCTCGALIWIPLLTGKGTKVKTHAVCQSCGYRWQIR